MNPLNPAHADTATPLRVFPGPPAALPAPSVELSIDAFCRAFEQVTGFRLDRVEQPAERSSAGLASGESRDRGPSGPSGPGGLRGGADEGRAGEGRQRSSEASGGAGRGSERQEGQRTSPPSAHLLPSGPLLASSSALVLGNPQVAADSGEMARNVQDVATLVRAVNDLLQDRRATLEALRSREAELASAIPVTLRRDESRVLAERLESVLRDAAQLLTYRAAAIYMLDDDTSQLKLRAAWGLPAERLLDAARPLSTAVSDLEAMLGHIVVLEDTSLLSPWRCPEQASAAVCVPLSSSSQPLGTLWLFSDEVRHPGDQEANILELVAGRIVAELERAALGRECRLTRQLEQELAEVSKWQDECLPVFEPPLAGWQLAGWTGRVDHLGGSFHGWHELSDEGLLLTVGSGQGGMLEGSMTNGFLQGALAAAAQRLACRDSAGQLLDELSSLLWQHSSGDKRAALHGVLLDTRTGQLRFAGAGGGGAAVIRPSGITVLSSRREFLGEDPDVAYGDIRQTMQPGDVLLMCSEGVRRLVDRQGQRLDETTLAAGLRARRHQHAQSLLANVRRQLLCSRTLGHEEDCSLLVLRRVDSER